MGWQASNDSEDHVDDGDIVGVAGIDDIFGDPDELFGDEACDLSEGLPAPELDAAEGEVSAAAPKTPTAPEIDAGCEYGAAASSMPAALPADMAPPLPPPATPPASRAGSARGDRREAEVVVHFPMLGKISFYRGSGNFECVCLRENHNGGCRLTRTSKPSCRAGREGQGRPLGLMAAWLLCDLEIGSRAEHTNPFLVLGVISKEKRVEGRRRLRALPSGAALEACERPLRDDEPGSEPESVP